MYKEEGRLKVCIPGAPHFTRNSSDSARTSKDWLAAPPAATAAVGASRYMSAKFTMLPTCSSKKVRYEPVEIVG